MKKFGRICLLVLALFLIGSSFDLVFFAKNGESGFGALFLLFLGAGLLGAYIDVSEKAEKKGEYPEFVDVDVV